MLSGSLGQNNTHTLSIEREKESIVPGIPATLTEHPIIGSKGRLCTFRRPFQYVRLELPVKSSQGANVGDSK